MILRNIFLAYVVCLFVVAFGVTGPKAAVLYEVAPAGSLNTPAANSAGTRTAFDDFSLTDAATVTSVSWLGTGSLATDVYQVGIYASTSQHLSLRRPVATPIFEITSTAGGTVNSQDEATRDYSVDLGAGIFLEADTAYWFSVRNLTRAFWLWKGDTTGFFISRDAAGNDFPSQLSLFFTLEGELGGGPAIAMSGPPVAALLGLGLIGMGFVRRRTRPDLRERRQVRYAAHPLFNHPAFQQGLKP